MPAQIVQFLGHPLEQLNPAELAELRGMFAAIRDGESKWADYVDKQEGAADARAARKAETDALNAKIQGTAKQPPPPEAATTDAKQPPEQETTTTPATPKKAGAMTALTAIGKAGIPVDVATAFLVSRGNIKSGATFMDAHPTVYGEIVADPEAFKKAVNAWADAKNQ
jgi:hypothetical protein